MIRLLPFLHILLLQKTQKILDSRMGTSQNAQRNLSITASMGSVVT